MYVVNQARQFPVSDFLGEFLSPPDDRFPTGVYGAGHYGLTRFPSRLGA